jgi:hypothetical protein
LKVPAVPLLRNLLGLTPPMGGNGRSAPYNGFTLFNHEVLS